MAVRAGGKFHYIKTLPSPSVCSPPIRNSSLLSSQILNLTHIMPPRFEHLSVNLLFIVIGVISPFPALAIPLSPQDPPTLFELVIPESSHKLIFGIVFVFSKANVHCSPEHLCSLRSVSSAFHHYRDRICMRGIPNAAFQVH